MDARRDGQGSRPPEAREKDLSKLSFEERMAYYKNKYGSDEAAANAERQAAGAGSSQGQNRTPRNGPQRGSQTKGGTNQANRNSQGSRDGRGQPNRDKPQNGQRRPAAQQSTNQTRQQRPAAAPVASTPKKDKGGISITGFIKKLFGKK